MGGLPFSLQIVSVIQDNNLYTETIMLVFVSMSTCSCLNSKCRLSVTKPTFTAVIRSAYTYTPRNRTIAKHYLGRFLVSLSDALLQQTTPKR
jgi:hypothetical protein